MDIWATKAKISYSYLQNTFSTAVCISVSCIWLLWYTPEQQNHFCTVQKAGTDIGFDILPHDTALEQLSVIVQYATVLPVHNSAVTIINIDIDIAIYFRYRSISISRYMLVFRPRFPSSDMMLCIDVWTVQGLIKIRGLTRTQILESAHLWCFVCHGRRRLRIKLTQSLCCPLPVLIPRRCV